ncbi:hypothetical protein FSP39_014624 [Pinctada imbricata]|uniref:Fanconi Anaemia group E protein C-terminal domain-containing protein n=1 Tax=Pinctada imbricata TaxID=66713 RepID=A0AA89BJE5_PINIB|nr:hypothetical protein FSP39_014624 [Pinctada imbricata]
MPIMDLSLDQQLDLNSIIPPSWNGLFKSLSAPDRQSSQNASELWYRNEAMSLYGSRPKWAELLQSLSNAEPIIKEGQLKFLPYFCHLNSDMQNRLLLFLLQQRHLIQSNILLSFLESLRNVLPPDSWAEAYYRMLKAHLILEIDGKINTSTNMKDTEPEELVYQFSSKNHELLNSVKHTLSKEGDQRDKIWKPDTTNLERKDNLRHVETQKTDPRREENASLSCDNKNNVKENKVSDSSLEKLNEDVIMILDDDEDDNMNEPPAKKQRVDNKDDNAAEDTEMKAEISQEIKVKIEKLQECWKSGNASQIPKELELLYTTRTEQMEQICQHLSNTTADESCLAIACHHLTTISDVITYDNCVIYLSHNILPQFSSLSQSASRVFTSTVLLLSDKYPKPLIEGVIVPCIKNEKFGSPQLDVTIKVIREVLSDSNKVLLLRCLSNTEILLDDNVVALYQAVIDSKTILNIEKLLVRDILVQYQRSASKLKKSLKFGKLILAFLNKYGSQVTLEDMGILHDVVNSHGTFLKKTLEAHIRNIKSKL